MTQHFTRQAYEELHKTPNARGSTLEELAYCLMTIAGADAIDINTPTPETKAHGYDLAFFKGDRISILSYSSSKWSLENSFNPQSEISQAALMDVRRQLEDSCQTSD